MPRNSFTFDGSGTNSGSRVVVGDHDLSSAVRGVTVRAEVGCVTTVELDLCVYDITRMDSPDVEVLIPPATHDALVALGWTPPTE